MQAGAVIGQAWELYKAHWRHFITISFVIYALISVLTVFLVLTLGGIGAIIAGFITLAGVYWLQGALVIAVEDARDGRVDMSLRDTLNRLREHINTLSIASVVILVALIVAGILILLGLVALIVPGLVLIGVFIWLLVRWILLIPVIILEDKGVFASLDRSAELVRGNWWPMFAIVLVTIVVQIGVGIAVAILVSPLPDWGQGFVGNLVSSTLAAPFAALAWTLAYHQLRALKEPEPAPAPAPA